MSVIGTVTCLMFGSIYAQIGPSAKGARAKPDLRGPGMLVVEVVPSTTLINAGTPLTADIVVSGLTNMGASSLGAFDIDFSWDPAVVAFSNISFGTDLGNEGLGEAITGNTPGPMTVNAFEVSLLTAITLNMDQPDSFTLFTVTLDMLVAGTTSLDVVLNSLGDENGAPLMGTPINATVGVAPPLPATQIPTLSQWGLVFLTVLLGFVGLSRLRRAGR